MRVSAEAEEFFEKWGVLRKAVEAGASDLHLCDHSRPVARIQGELLPIDEVLLGEEHMYHLLKFLTDGPMLARFYDPDTLEDLDHTVEFPGLGRRFRVNIFRQNNGNSIVMRTLSPQTREFSSLGLPSNFAKVADERSGLVLVTGVTGSGKSTTLASIIEMINTKYRRHIVTIEDPIEVVFQNRLSLIEQREVGSHVAGFHQALRSALRQAPDVLLIGEIRDSETAQMALRAAQVGVLVLATLHTRSAVESVGRLMGLFEDSFRAGARQQIADCLRATLCQMLVPSKDRRAMVPCCELMWSTNAVRHLIRDDKTYLLPSLMEIASSEGMITMEQSLLRAFREERISLESAYSYAIDKASFLAQLEPHLHREIQIQWETDVELKRLEALRETARRQSMIRNA